MAPRKRPDGGRRDHVEVASGPVAINAVAAGENDEMNGERDE